MTPADLDAAIRERRGAGLEAAYLDFVATVGLLDQPNAPAPYRYEQPALPRGLHASRDALAPGETKRASVHQYAARFFELPPGRIAIDLRGTTHVRLLHTDPHSGNWLWWSNRADSLGTTLTRTVDLHSVDRATLTYWAWYDIEDRFDYAYIEASTDGARPGRRSARPRLATPIRMATTLATA